jgi:4-hydroxy-3-methylbut-2-enyl diphosphate reductase IspH
MFSMWQNAFKDMATLAQRNMGAAAATANNMTQAASDAATNVADAATAAAATATTSGIQATASAPEVLVPAVDPTIDASGSDKKIYPTAGGKKK